MMLRNDFYNISYNTDIDKGILITIKFENIDPAE